MRLLQPSHSRDGAQWRLPRPAGGMGNLLPGKASARMMRVWEDCMDGELGMH